MKLDIRSLDELTDLEKLALQYSSYSRLNGFDWCQAQYFYNYIIKIPQESGDKALLGNIIHKALELTVRDGEVTKLPELLDNYRAAYEDYDPDETIISDELYQVGIEMLQDYVVREGHRKETITEAEQEFSFVFNSTLIRGFMDRIFVDGDKVYIEDLKSGTWQVADKKVPTDLQLGIYALYAKYLYPDKQITASLYYLRNGKKKSYTFSDEDFEGIQERLRAQIDKVRNRTNYLPTQEQWKCKMCSYAKDATCPTGRGIYDRAKNSSVKYQSQYYS